MYIEPAIIRARREAIYTMKDSLVLTLVGSILTRNDLTFAFTFSWSFAPKNRDSQA